MEMHKNLSEQISGSSALAVTAVISHIATLVVGALTKQLGVGHSAPLLFQSQKVSSQVAVCALTIMHVSYGGSLVWSAFEGRWQSAAYWRAIGGSLLTIIWLVLTTVVRDRPSTGEPNSSRSGIGAGLVTGLFRLAAEYLRHLCLAGLASLLYRLWWDLQQLAEQHSVTFFEITHLLF